MLYLLDANTLINAQDMYYGMDCVPEFWSWLEFQVKKNVCRIPPMIYEEIQPKSTEFRQWLQRNKNTLILNEVENTELIRHVITQGYGNQITDIQLKRIGADPFLVASALEDSHDRCVVTNEVSKPSAKGTKRKIPDICDQLKIQCISMVDFIKIVGFKTQWRSETSQSDKLKYSECQQLQLVE